MPSFAAGTPGYVLLVLVFCLVWSSAFAVAKLALEVCPPNLFLGMRFLLGALPLIGWAWARGELRGLGWQLWLGLVALGMLNQTGFNGFVWVGLESVSSGLAAIIISTNPIFIAALAVPVLGERLTGAKIGGLLLGFAGVALVLRNRTVVTGEDATAIAFVVAGLASLVAGTLLFKRWAPRASLAAVVGVQMLCAGAVLGGVGLAVEDPAAIRPGALLAFVLAYNGVAVSLGGFVLWFFLLRAGSATAASALHFLMPPLGLLFGWLLLGEPVEPLELAGILPIAAGIWLVTRGPAAPVRADVPGR